MRKKRFGVEQMIGVLKQAEVGVPVAEVIRRADQRADVLSVEGEVRRFGSGPGSPDGATAAPRCCWRLIKREILRLCRRGRRTLRVPEVCLQLLLLLFPNPIV